MAADNEKLEQLRRQLDEVMPEIPARFWLNLETDYQITRALTFGTFLQTERALD